MNNLIFDVGLHEAMDTTYYLKKGFKVVSFEANPELVESASKKFEKEIENGDLKIVSGAIIDPEIHKDPTVTFYLNSKNSVWGTIVPAWAKRNETFNSTNTTITVPAINFAEQLKQYGIPHYLKIDIEGMDYVCLKSLKEFDLRPSYISIESEKVDFDNLIKEIDLLTDLGYDKFKVINQATVQNLNEPNPSEEGNFSAHKYEFGSSGPFGKDLPNKWLNRNKTIETYKNIFRNYKLFGDKGLLVRNAIYPLAHRLYYKFAKKPIVGWYDTHAKHQSTD